MTSALAALWTPPGRGAIATIRVAMPTSWPQLDQLPFRAASGKPLSAHAIGRIVFGRWGTDAVEDVVCCAVDAQTLEIHCHGGVAAAERIQDDLEAAGCRTVEWTELLRQKDGPLRVELLAEVSRATTVRTAALLWEQANGVFESAVRQLVRTAADDLSKTSAILRSWLARAEFGLHLTRPWKVVIGGRPNVGKSSLINAILGYTRSIVFDQPGTTRDVVTAHTAIDGWPIELSDTAGLRPSNDPIESAGVDKARATLRGADLRVLLLDLSESAADADRMLLIESPDALVVAHKCDLPIYKGPGRWPATESERWIPASSKTGAGIDAVVKVIHRRLVPEVPAGDALIPVTPRHVSLIEEALAACERGDTAAVQRNLADLLGQTSECEASDQSPSANVKGLPAIS